MRRKTKWENFLVGAAFASAGISAVAAGARGESGYAAMFLAVMCLAAFNLQLMD